MASSVCFELQEVSSVYLEVSEADFEVYEASSGCWRQAVGAGSRQCVSGGT